MVLYLGSEEKLPLIPYNPHMPAFNTRELDEQEKPVLKHFSLPHITYIGSNEGCGCSFRHALYDKGEWTHIVWEEGEEAIASRADHQALVDYLKASMLENFEIYACWNGDYDLPSEFEEKVIADDLMHSEFFFREKAHYWINIDRIQGSTKD